MRFRKKRSILIKKKHIRIAVIVLALLIALITIILVVSANKKLAEKQKAIDNITSQGVIKVGLRGDIGALCTYDTDREIYEGLEKDLADELISRLFEQDILVEFVNVNSETKNAMLRVGDADISFGASLFQDTSGIVYSNSYYSDGCAFLVMQGSTESEAGLEGKTIAIIQGSLPASETSDKNELTKLESYLKAHEIDAVLKKYASYPEAVEALDAGFVDAVCANEIFLKIYGKKGMLILPERFIPNDFCVAVREPLEKFRDVINDTLLIMQKDGTMDALISKWNLVNYAALGE